MDSVPDEVNGFSSLPNPSNHTMTLGYIQRLTEMSTDDLRPGGGGEGERGRLVRLTAICEPTV
jgi:hypothetical protein